MKRVVLVLLLAVFVTGFFLGLSYVDMNPVAEHKPVDGDPEPFGFRVVLAVVLLTLLFMGLLAFGGVVLFSIRWLHSRASLICADDNGLYPVVKGRIGNTVYYHDPNRAPTSTTIYVSPTDVQYMAMPGMQEEQFRITSQAQLGQAMAAGSANGVRDNSGRTFLELLTYRDSVSAPIPEVKISDLSPAHIERLLIESGEIER